MTKQNFLMELERELALPAGSVDERKRLQEIEGWDSMATVQVIALADEKLGATLSGGQIRSSMTVQQLLDLFGDRLSA